MWGSRSQLASRSSVVPSVYGSFPSGVERETLSSIFGHHHSIHLDNQLSLLLTLLPHNNYYNSCIDSIELVLVISSGSSSRSIRQHSQPQSQPQQKSKKSELWQYKCVSSLLLSLLATDATFQGGWVLLLHHTSSRTYYTQYRH